MYVPVYFQLCKGTYVHKRYLRTYLYNIFSILTSFCFFTPRFFRDAFGIAPQDFMVSGSASNVRMHVCMSLIQKSHSPTACLVRQATR